MKTTIKLGELRSLVMEPAPDAQAARVVLMVGPVAMAHGTITEDQLGAAIFGLEQVAEVLAQRRERVPS